MEINTLSGNDITSLILFFSRFIKAGSETWTLLPKERTHTIANTYFSCNKSRIAQLLPRLHPSLELDCKQDAEKTEICVKDKQQSKTLSLEAIISLAKALDEQIVNKKECEIPFDKNNQEIVKAGKELLKKLCPYIPPEEIDQIEANPYIISGGELARYECFFMGGGRHVMYPNPHHFQKEHLEVLNTSLFFEEQSAKQNELSGHVSLKLCALLYYHYVGYVAMLHEMSHCVQTILKQKDASSWSAEHDASVVSFPLLTQVQKEYNLLEQGKIEETALWLFEHCRLLHCNITEECKAKYREWRSKFGLAIPLPEALAASAQDAFAIAFSDHKISRISTYVKQRVTIEAYLHERYSMDASLAKDFLNTCFHNRAGDVWAIELKLTESVQIDRHDTSTFDHYQ